tara:strand:- start:194430 stop:194951 length:522 start_codon:yes stop_codon:yes gene_type:complete
MRWADIGQQVCSVSRSLSVVGDKWTLLIIRSAFLGARRFTDFEAETGITRHRLSDRLNKLVQEEFLEKIEYQKVPLRYEYRLTASGTELYPIVMSLVKWGDKWKVEKDGKPMEYIHNKCGSKIMPLLTCPECSEEIEPHDMTVVAGPGIKAAIGRERLEFLDRFLKDDANFAS